MIFNNFVTRLNEKDFEDFVNEKCDELRIHKAPNVNKQSSYVRYNICSYGPSPEFKFDDFHFVGINSYSSYNYSNAWRKFMFAKFGEEYQQSLLKFANEQKKEIVDSLLY